MSFIDTFQHQLCGFLAGVPVYRAEQDISGEFTAAAGTLVLGGGSGEHPAAVVDMPAAVSVAFEEYLELLWCPVCDGDGQRIQTNGGRVPCTGCAATGLDVQEQTHGLDLEQVREFNPAAWAVTSAAAEAGIPATEVAAMLREVSDALVGHDLTRVHAPIDCSAWGGDDWARVVSRAASGTILGPGYQEAQHRSIESWLAGCVGEYALVTDAWVMTAMTRLTASQVALVFAVAGVAARSPLFAGVATYPKGYLLGGRGERLGEPNMRH